jgi:hypothetical protein
VVENLKGISLKNCKYFPSLCQINPKGFHNLKCLDLTKASPTIVENFIQGQNLNNLRWLCLKNCELKKLPSNLFYCSHLQVLNLTKCHFLQNNFDYFNHNVNSSLNVDRKQIFTSIFSQLSALQELDLSWCSDLQELPTSIGQLNALQKLNLLNCNKLQKLPTSIGQLNALQVLDLSWCEDLQELPTSIGQLNALRKFVLLNCTKLQKLPSSIGQLSALQELNLSCCWNLQELPTSIDQLSALEKLDLWGCSNLKELPTSIGQLSGLENFYLKGCWNMKELPTSKGQWSALEKFYLCKDSNLGYLPTSELNGLKYYLKYKRGDFMCDQLSKLIFRYNLTASILIDSISMGGR